MDALTFLGLDRIENRIYDIWCERYYLHSTSKKAFDALLASTRVVRAPLFVVPPYNIHFLSYVNI